MSPIALAIALALQSSPAVASAKAGASVAFDDDTLSAMAADAGWHALTQGSGMVRELRPSECERKGHGGKGHK